jgi:D-alanine-D-alanine ligase
VKKKKVIVLAHQDLIPPSTHVTQEESEYAPWATEYNVCKQLKKSGHELKIVPVGDEIRSVEKEISNFSPDVVFNLMEEFNGDVSKDHNIASLLELLNVPYTGCSSKGLMLARDKALTKKVLQFHGIKTPEFQVYPLNKKITELKKIKYPVIIKCLNEEASLGISKSSIVTNFNKLKERVSYLQRQFSVDVIAEEFIEGRELYVGVMGHKRVKALPIWELIFSKTQNTHKEIYTELCKHSKKHREKKGVTTEKAKLAKAIENEIQTVCKKAFQFLELNSIARFDIRLSSDNIPYIIEVNPNPNISSFDEFALSAKYAGISYCELLEKMMGMAKRRVA